eukprot:Skav232900  [mRNA]  locus=scaffold1477:215789:216946:- [translate_table: standard]
MLRVVSALSGEVIVTLSTDEVNGRPAKDLKIRLVSIIGISRFRQRLFLEDGSEVVGEELSLTPQDVQLVLLQFKTPDVAHEVRLMRASRACHVQALQECLEEPQDPNLHFRFLDGPQCGGTCAIHLVASQGSLQCLRLLLEAGADKDSSTMAPRTHGETPLIAAVERGHIDVVCFLVEAGADMNKPMNNGATPLYLAASLGHIEVVRFLVRVRADMNKALHDGATPLLVAAQSGHMNIVRFLFEASADSHTAMNNGTTPLFLAALYGHIEVVRFLVEAGADLNKAPYDGATPVLVAAQFGHFEVVRFLVAASADTNKAADNGETALSAATRNGHWVIKFFLMMKARPKLQRLCVVVLRLLQISTLIWLTSLLKPALTRTRLCMKV